MKDESIELELISEENESATKVRQFFRIPVPDKESIQVLINQKKYLVSNISQEGIGISTDNQLDPESGEILTDCELIFKKTSLIGLTGRVIHRSSSVPLQYGIQWLDLQPGQRQTLDEILLQMKVRALENNDRNISKI